MAARLNRRHQEMIREKIRASQLVNRLENYVLGPAEGQEPVHLEPGQITAALGLLRKCVPDLKASDLDLTVDGKIEVGIVSFADIIAEQLDT